MRTLQFSFPYPAPDFAIPLSPEEFRLAVSFGMCRLLQGEAQSHQPRHNVAHAVATVARMHHIVGFREGRVGLPFRQAVYFAALLHALDHPGTAQRNEFPGRATHPQLSHAEAAAQAAGVIAHEVGFSLLIQPLVGRLIRATDPAAIPCNEIEWLMARAAYGMGEQNPTLHWLGERIQCLREEQLGQRPATVREWLDREKKPLIAMQNNPLCPPGVRQTARIMVCQLTALQIDPGFELAQLVEGLVTPLLPQAKQRDRHLRALLGD